MFTYELFPSVAPGQLVEDEGGRIRPDLAAFNLKQDKEASEVVLIYLQRQRQRLRGIRGCPFLHVKTKTQDKDKETSEVVLKSNNKVCHTNGNFLHKIWGADLVFQWNILNII